jgi:peptidoglycan/LPS O-acetylase OafA/YrhL
MTRRMSGTLDCMRWISAILVVVSHTADLMLAHFAQTPVLFRSGLVYAWSFSSGFGHQAVTVFYVLSGFLVGGPLVRVVHDEGAIPWKRYSVDRIVRIYLVLIPALCFCFVVDRLSYKMMPDWVGEFIQYHSGWSIFAGNLLNLQNFYLPFFGSDGPIGTLAIEMWFYITFPLLLASRCFRYAFQTRILLVSVGITVIAALSLAQPAFLCGFAIWGFGVAARLWKRPIFTSPYLPTLCFVLSVLTVRVAMRRELSEHLWKLFISDLFLASTISILLVTINHLPDTRRSFFFWKGHKRIAGFSYSLYATHMPLLFLLTSASKITFGFGIQDYIVQISQWALVLLAISICISFASLFSMATERHTASLREWVLSNLGSSD